MAEVTRRRFVQAVAAGAVLGRELMRPASAGATPLGLPLGLQLYSVREQLPGDSQATLDRIGELGYREVEAAGFYKYTAAQVRQGMDNANLRCVSAHYGMTQLSAELPQTLDFLKEVGAEYVICASPGRKNPAAVGTGIAHSGGMTIEDWRWNAEQFNQMAAKAKAAGLQFGYHNHVAEFATTGGVVPYDELLRLTDPALVTFEMDCGWVMVGGGDPVAYLKKYPTRISMLHVKDFKPKVAGQERPEAAELGRGTVDYKPIFAAAKVAGGIKHCFVEQEGFDVPWDEALKIDAEYMKGFAG